VSSNDLLQALLGGTRRRLVDRLRPEDRTVRELADALDLTKSAVRMQLSKLEESGFVEVTGRRPTRRKPEHVYGLTDEAEALFRTSYETLLNTVLAVVSDSESASASAILQETGRRIAVSQEPASPESPVVERAEQARQVLENMGGLPELKRGNGAFWIEGKSCPIASVVRAHGAQACEVARILIEELTDRPVERRCETDEEAPRCKFRIDGG